MKEERQAQGAWRSSNADTSSYQVVSKHACYRTTYLTEFVNPYEINEVSFASAARILLL